MNGSRRFLYATLVIVLYSSDLPAQLIDDYQAPGNPTDQGWDEAPDGGFPTVGDGTDTLEYWLINDDSNAAGAYVPSDLVEWNTEQPWQMESVMRLASGSGPAEIGFGLQSIDADRYFRVELATDGVYYQGSGNAVTAYFDGIAAEFDTSEYHRYELTVNASEGKPSSDQVTLHIDGELVADLTRGDIRALGAGPTMNFGSGSSGGRAEMHYHFVQLTHDISILGVAPKPPTVGFVWDTASGDWNVAGNWSPSGGSPGKDAFRSQHGVTFGNSIGNNMRTVFTDDAVTVNSISFNNTMGGGYRIAGGPSINLISSTVDPPVTPSISVSQGTHRFQVPVLLHNDTSVDVEADSILIFDGALDLMGNTLTKTGAGEISIRNDLLTDGGALAVENGVLSGSGTVGGDVQNNGGTISPGNRSLAVTGVPEPCTLILLVLGGGLLLGVRRV